MLSSLMLTLALAPPPPPAGDTPAADQLQTALDGATRKDRQAAIDELLVALERYAADPQLAQSGGLSEAELEARVILVRLYLAKKDKAAAEAAMDQLIRLSQGQEPPVREYGGKVTKLYKARKQALEDAGSAMLTVECEVECEVVVAQRKVEGGSASLLLGTYDLWILATERDVGWERRELVLDEAGEIVVERYADPTPPEPEPEPEPDPALEASSTRGPRSLPRGVEIAGLAAGVGLIVAGAVLLSFDDKCSISGQPVTPESTPEACGNVYETTAGGAALLGVGGGLFALSGLMLAVDEVRVGRTTERRVSVGVSFKF